MSEPAIALVFSPEPWVERLHRHLADHGGARVRQIVLDPALALEEHYDVLVVSHRWPGLTHRLVAALDERGRSVLGVFDPDEPAGRDHLVALGAAEVVASDVPVGQFVELLAKLPGATPADDRPTRPSDDRATHDAPATRGPLVVTGMPGAGVTEIALALAHASSRRRATALVDVQERGPSLAVRLGLPLEPGLRDAVDAVEHAAGPLVEVLTRVAPRLDVVPGAVGGPATAVQAHEVRAVVDALTVTGRSVVTDANPVGVGRVLLADAEAVVFVAAASPTGVAQVLAWASEHPYLLGSSRAHVVFNRAPRERFRRGELEGELVRTLGPVRVWFTPADVRVDGAAWDGGLVPRGAFVSAVGPIADTVATATRSYQRRGHRRRAERGMTVDAYDVIRLDAAAGVERRRLRPDGDLEEVRVEVERAIADYQARARLGDALPLAAPDVMGERVLRSITDLGPLTELLARRDVEEIFIEGARVSFLDGTGRLRGMTMPTSEEENRLLVDRLLAATERQLNTKHPMVQARVLGGTARLTAAIPPVGDCLSVTLRRYVVRNVTLADLVGRDALTAEAAAFLDALMQLRSRIAVSGEPGAGKTTLAAALLAAAPPSHCVRSCEEIRELAVPITHGSYYEVRPPALDGTGEITMRDLVKFVLAMRPDRIVVGEVRGAEAFELSRAVNAGCGFLCTVHANSAAEALDALVNAALMAGENVTERIVRKVFSESIDIVIHVDRDDTSGDGTGIRRQIVEIAAVVPALRDDFTLEPLFTRPHLGGPLTWTGALPARLERRMTRVLSHAELHAVVDAGGRA